ncbi:uncharacterized protein F5891DRAFT_1070887 [Suillus fuscotomentosus]|uniref:Uncharacterized protein n=1 Tax=Suillus fuscotomentosus TaxID=1912939 RepID=A0AAD4DQZ5_9AGAM|nr:uncharacterized protein F5891DRAFT_1070887 [Suillus fuscotomentosus]KAG1890602.1 hypothetical protein F5891DRAFT_1070887 [Suillus fuscotomentosus]
MYLPSFLATVARDLLVLFLFGLSFSGYVALIRPGKRCQPSRSPRLSVLNKTTVCLSPRLLAEYKERDNSQIDVYSDWSRV